MGNEVSNEPMTDARALADEYRPSMDLEVLHSWAAEAVARLRGEAAQGEQEAVAWTSPEGMERLRTQDDSATVVPEAFRDSRHTIPLYDRPQPVAGDAVRALLVELDEWLHSCPDPSKVNPRWMVRKPSRLLWACRDMIAALSTQPAPSEQVAASAAQQFRVLLAEARREYRDDTAAGDVLAWLDERVLDVDRAASVCCFPTCGCDPKGHCARGPVMAASVAVPGLSELEASIIEEAANVLSDVATMHGENLPTCWRWPLVDELRGMASIAAAPVAPEREV